MVSAPVAILLRDLSLLGLTGLLWFCDALLRGEGWPGQLIGVLAGVATAGCGYLAHEWGHLGGAKLARSVVHLPSSAATLFLFRFDSDRNTRGQFLCMSVGGFVASGIMVALLFCFLPLEATSGRVAIGLTLLGVLATIILEFPPAWQVARGAPIPRGGAYQSSES